MSKFGFVLVTSVAMAASAAAQMVLVQPYLQPGNGATLQGSDVKVLRWLTDQTPGDFKVFYGRRDAATNVATATRVALDFQPAKPSSRPTNNVASNAIVIPEREQHYFKYTSTMSGLPFDAEIEYRVLLGERVVRAGTFSTRSSADKSIRFIMVGDIASGRPQQNAVAWQMAQARPQFMVVLGDIVYASGRVNQYMHHFWGTYNQPAQPGPTQGAPLMASVTLYPVLGNHDVESARLPDYPDAFGAYHFFDVPQNGPGLGSWNTPLGRDAGVAESFRASVGGTYPSLGFYSFDNGPAHFVALDSANYVTNLSGTAAIMTWLENDLKNTRARWKFVCFHVPPFQSTKTHYPEQRMRLLEPLFERQGVDVVWTGHVHNYQRNVPLRFQPNSPIRQTNGTVNGEFKLDHEFDGITKTRPDGVIHIVSGGGGASLYAGGPEKNAAELREKYSSANWADFNAKFFDRTHSFSVVDLSPTRLELRVLDMEGQEVDRMTVTKP